MTWVRVDASVFGNPKVRRVPPPAKLLYVAGLCYCAEHLTDGRIPREALAAIGATLGIRPTPAVRHLADAGLWAVVDDGWLVPDYCYRNPSRAEVEERRRADRERKRGHGQGEKRARSEREAREKRARSGQETVREQDAKSTRRKPSTSADGTGSGPESERRPRRNPGDNGTERTSPSPPHAEGPAEVDPSPPSGRPEEADIWATMAARKLRLAVEAGTAPPEGRRRARWVEAVETDLAIAHGHDLIALLAERPDAEVDWLVWRLDPDLAERNYALPGPERQAEIAAERAREAEEAASSAEAARHAQAAREALDAADRAFLEVADDPDDAA